MSQAIKDWIEDEREQILDDYCFCKIAFDEGIAALKRLGFNTNEARDMLLEAGGPDLWAAGAGGIK